MVNIGAVIVLAAIIIIGIIVLTIMGFRTVNPGEAGILVTFGNADMVERGQGMHIVNPFGQKMEIVDVSTQKIEAKAGSASKDLQDVSTTIAINFHIDPTNAAELYSQFKGQFVDRIITPAIQEIVKQTTAQYTAAELITKRDAVKTTIADSLSKRLAQYKVTVDAVSITQFDFSAGFNKAIEEKVKAAQEAQRAENVLTRIQIEAQQKIATAEGDKNSTVLSAEGKKISAGPRVRRSGRSNQECRKCNRRFAALSEMV